MSNYGGALGLCERAKQQPDRHPDDKDPRLTWSGHMLLIEVGDQHIGLSAFNAWRVFGLMSFMLGLPLPLRIQRMIKL